MGDTAVVADQPVKGKQVPSGLQPFTKDNAREMALRSAEVRRAKREAIEAEKRKGTELLASLRETHRREDLGEFSALFVLEVLQRVLRGEIPIRNGSEAAAVMREAHQIHRLETGQATSHAVTLRASAEDVLSRIETVRGSLPDDTKGSSNPTSSPIGKGR